MNWNIRLRTHVQDIFHFSCILCIFEGACLTSAPFFNRFRVNNPLLFNPTKAIENPADFAFACYKNTIDGITSSYFVKPSVTDTGSIRSNSLHVDTFIIFPQQSSSAWAVIHNICLWIKGLFTLSVDVNVWFCFYGSEPIHCTDISVIINTFLKLMLTLTQTLRVSKAI